MTIAGFDRRDANMLANLFRMSLNDRFLGSGLGAIWAILSPLLLLGIFTFVFTFVFPSRLPGHDSKLYFVIWLISGYGPWLGISEGLSFATGSVVANSGIVKNIAFKSELLPVVGAMMGLVPLTVAFGLILVLMIISGQLPSPYLLTLPLPLILQLIFVSGLGLFLGALNVFVRDTQLILPNVLTLTLFASPIFYPLTAYPVWVRSILVFNPFYVLAEGYREPLLSGTMQPWWMILYMLVVSLVIFAGGLWWFRRLKNFFDTRL